MAEFIGSQPGRGRKSRNRTTTKILFWNVEFHLIFLQAVILIGDRGERVVPNKVLEVMKEDVRSSEILKAMNVQKLTRAHVGSHLQKLRRFLYSESERRNKFAMWHYHDCRVYQAHEDIKRRQLVAKPRRRRDRAPNGLCLGVPLATQQDESIFCLPNNNNLNAAVPKIYSAQGEFDYNYDQNMACFTESYVGPATPTICPPISAPQAAAFDVMNPCYSNQQQGIGERFGAGQPETSQYSSLFYDASTDLQAIFNDGNFGLELPEDLEYWNSTLWP